MAGMAAVAASKEVAAEDAYVCLLGGQSAEPNTKYELCDKNESFNGNQSLKCLVKKKPLDFSQKPPTLVPL